MEGRNERKGGRKWTRQRQEVRERGSETEKGKRSSTEDRRKEGRYGIDEGGVVSNTCSFLEGSGEKKVKPFLRVFLEVPFSFAVGDVTGDVGAASTLLGVKKGKGKGKGGRDIFNRLQPKRICAVEIKFHKKYQYSKGQVP